MSGGLDLAALLGEIAGAVGADGLAEVGAVLSGPAVYQLSDDAGAGEDDGAELFAHTHL